jgi:hypothetical protein
MVFRPPAPVAPPALGISASSSNVQLAWTTNASGFRLVTAARLESNVTWLTITNAVSVENGSNRVTMPATSSNQFFRLAKP